MLDRDVKISNGLHRLLTGSTRGHFRPYSDIFVDDPQNRNDYFEMFSKAQIVDIANTRY